MKQLATALLVLLSVAFAGYLPDEPPYTNPVTVKSTDPGVTLESVLKAAAKTAGVPILLDNVPDVEVSVDFKDVPFSRFLDLMLKVYAPELDYTLLPEGVVLVAPKETIARVAPNPPPGKTAKGGKGKAGGKGTMAVLLDAEASGEALAEAARSMGVEDAVYIPAAKAVLLRGPAELLEQVVPLLRKIEARAKSQKEKEEAQAEAKEAAAALPPPPPPIPEELANAEEPKTITKVLTIPGAQQIKGLKELAQSFGVTVFTPAPDTLVVRGAEKDVEAFIAVVEKVANAAIDKRVTLTYTLDPALDPKAVASLVTSVFPKAKVTVQNGLLIVTLPEDELERANKEIPKLIESIQKAGSNKPSFLAKVYPIFGDPKDIAKGLKALLAAKKGDRLGYRVEVMDSQKAVLVYGPISFHREVVNFLREADPPKGSGARAGAGGEPVKARLQLHYLSPESAKKYLEALGIKDIKIVPEKEGHALWVEGTPEAVAQARAYLEVLDQKPAQTKLAVRVYQVERSALQKLGPKLTASLAGLNVAFSATGLTTGYTLPAEVANMLTLNLNALEGKGLAKTLVSTETLARDGTTASLVSGGTLYLIQQQEGKGGEDNQAAAAANLGTIEYGLVIKLKPTIYPDHSVEIDASLELGGLPTQGPISGTIDVHKQKVSGTLRLQQGYTGVLGGLIYQETTEDQKAVPILSDIPLLGELFKSTSTGRKETVLLTMITPVEVDAPELPKVTIFGEPKKGQDNDTNKSVSDPRKPPVPPKSSVSPTSSAFQTDLVGSWGTLITPEPRLADYIARYIPGTSGSLLYVGGGPGTAYAEIERIYVGVPTDPGVFRVEEIPWRASLKRFGNGRVVVVSLPREIPRGDVIIIEAKTEAGLKGYIIIPLRSADQEG